MKSFGGRRADAGSPWVRPRNGLEVGGDIGDCTPERSDVVEAIARGEHAGPADQPVGWLETSEAACGGRKTNGAAGVGAKVGVSQF